MRLELIVYVTLLLKAIIFLKRKPVSLPVFWGICMIFGRLCTNLIYLAVSIFYYLHLANFSNNSTSKTIICFKVVPVLNVDVLTGLLTNGSYIGNNTGLSGRTV
jgi:asparagine N-glycosylation enzyme membrane subunit Stt3